MTIALETKGLEKSFGGLRVTRDLSLVVEQGARHALIGPNGAGKTTVINLLTGVLRPNAGRILLGGGDLTDLPIGLWDERLSTAAVERELIGMDVSRARRAQVIDTHAAIFILQGALDRLTTLRRSGQ